MDIHTLTDSIRTQLEPIIQEPYYLVELEVKKTRQGIKISVFLDTDTGITIDECATISPIIAEKLDQLPLLQDGYTLEVSSPGVDRPLTNTRQILKNIGRRARIVLTDGKNLTARIEALQANQLHLTQLEAHPTAKGRWKETPLQIPMTQIANLQILID